MVDFLHTELMKKSVMADYVEEEAPLGDEFDDFIEEGRKLLAISHSRVASGGDEAAVAGTVWAALGELFTDETPDSGLLCAMPDFPTDVATFLTGAEGRRRRGDAAAATLLWQTPRRRRGGDAAVVTPRRRRRCCGDAAAAATLLWRRRGGDADIPPTNRGDAAATPHADIPPTNRGDAAAATRAFRGDEPGRCVEPGAFLRYVDQEVVEPLTLMGFGDRIEVASYRTSDGAPHPAWRLLISPSSVPDD